MTATSLGTEICGLQPSSFAEDLLAWRAPRARKSSIVVLDAVSMNALPSQPAKVGGPVAWGVFVSASRILVALDNGLDRLTLLGLEADGTVNTLMQARASAGARPLQAGDMLCVADGKRLLQFRSAELLRDKAVELGNAGTVLALGSWHAWLRNKDGTGRAINTRTMQVIDGLDKVEAEEYFAGRELLCWRGKFGCGLFIRRLGSDRGKLHESFNDPSVTITGFSVSTDESLVAWGNPTGYVGVISLVEGIELWARRLHRGHVTALAFAVDNSNLFSGDQTGGVCRTPFKTVARP